MQLNRQERQDLAQFFNRRFPDGGERLNLARRAGLPCGDAGDGDVLAWDELIELAAAKGELPRLARVARAAAPDDDNLRSLAELMAPPRAPLIWLAVPVAGFAAMTALVVAAWMVWPDAEHPVSAPDLVAVAGGYSGGEATAAPEVAAVIDPDPAVESAPAAPIVDLPKATRRAAVVSGPSGSGSAPSSTRCQAAQGELVGWWYAGGRDPVEVGSTYTLPTHANVRADYPDEHNHFNARAPLRCTLFPGDRVQVTHPSKRVPGNAWWVPLYGGDLLTDVL